ncbi:MAG TPA: adenylosuccinate lyase [bacterium]|nr:adenylosuccinate lyase [bacterium]HOL94595.1 adenylosuccinate lyase [bacterium]HPP01355.1 adenylosuccinate lyase [bacterium]
MIERYTRPEMGRIWSDQYRFEMWLKVEIAACAAHNRLGVVPDDALEEIKTKAAFEIPRIQELEKTVDHETIAFLTNVAEHVGPAARYIHYGMTSSDKLDTATALQLVAASDLLISGMRELRHSVGELAKKHRRTVMTGRTHGVHAEPVTFGFKLAIWHEELGRQIERLERARETVRVGKVSGAVGTYSHVDPRVEAIVCEELGLKPAPVSNQIIQRDRHAEYLAALANAGATLEKMALEIRGLQRTEIREVEEPFPAGQKGSSSMPHKKNPNLCERICGLARLLRAYAVTGFENVALWHERDISHSSVERVTLSDASILLDYMIHRMNWIIQNLVVYPERMRKNLNASNGLVFSQKVLLLLTRKGMSREDAYRIVQACALRVWDTERNLLDVLKEHAELKSVVSEKELEECFDLEGTLKNIDLIFERLGLV